MHKDAPPAAALLGYGRFGRAFASLLLDAGIKVTAYDPRAEIPAALRAGDLGALAAAADVVFAAVPVAATEEALAALRPHLRARHLVLDVASIKHGPVAAMTEVLGRDIPWAATHPLFGPMSVARGERPLQAVVCPNPLHPQAHKRARALYERAGCSVIEETADQHDRVMADTHALAFFVAKGMLEIGAHEDVAFAPPSFKAMTQTIDAVRSDAGHLFYAIARGNPHAEASRARLLDALTRIHRKIAETPDAGEQSRKELSIPSPAGPPPELKEMRELIDELDEQLISLLARRAQLAHHTARVKAGEGRAVRDPEREKSLLARRAEWAREYDLLPQEVLGVFDAILSFSRAEQRRWLAQHKEEGTA
ncbi:MAG: prephenate dehydrogenase/arogenate dehydrogenase family protein [Elusimicrobiota bacterium]